MVNLFLGLTGALGSIIFSFGATRCSHYCQGLEGRDMVEGVNFTKLQEWFNVPAPR
jgi:hypothetical protein